MSAAAAAASEEAYGGGGVEKGPLQQQPNPEVMFYMHNGVAYQNTPVLAAHQQPAGDNASAAPAPSPGTSWSADEPFKRKRGRPRKYAPDDVMPPSQTTAAASAPDGAAAAAPMLPPGFCHRPPGSSLKKLQPQRARQGGLAGLKPHIFTVQAGEDVASRAMSFSCNGWVVCILSANGAVSSVTLGQGDSSGGTITYEGCFEILSLAGSYLPSDSSGLSSRTSGLSVSLAGPDGRVLGGSVAGPLTAASPVQVVIGSFLCYGKEPDLSFAPGRLLYSTF